MADRNLGKPWLEVEDKIMHLAYPNEYFTVIGIATLLGRSVAGVNQRAHFLGINRPK